MTGSSRSIAGESRSIAGSSRSIAGSSRSRAQQPRSIAAQSSSMLPGPNEPTCRQRSSFRRPPGSLRRPLAGRLLPVPRLKPRPARLQPSRSSIYRSPATSAISIPPFVVSISSEVLAVSSARSASMRPLTVKASIEPWAWWADQSVASVAVPVLARGLSSRPGALGPKYLSLGVRLVLHPLGHLMAAARQEADPLRSRAVAGVAFGVPSSIAPRPWSAPAAREFGSPDRHPCRLSGVPTRTRNHGIRSARAEGVP